MSGPVAFSDVVEALQARARDVAEAYAPGGRMDRGRYVALCPWRADRHAGSFYVNLTGPYAGKFHDHATGEHGDMLDLIQLALGADRKGAFDEARRFLGLDAETPAQAAIRKRQAAVAAKSREASEVEAARARAGGMAAAGDLGALAGGSMAGTPVEAYLAGRGITLERLGRAPLALRFHPSLPYREVDGKTGEIVEGAFPAMLAAIYGPAAAGRAPAFWGVHRTWLAREGATWRKAPVPKPKKVLGAMRGGFVRLWAGQGAAPRVYVTEGLEDGLSAAVLRPAAMVLMAISLSNIAAMVLPPAIRRLTIVRDNDAAPEARAAIERAADLFRAQGRTVGIWANHHGGKDLNDALMAALAAEGAA